MTQATSQRSGLLRHSLFLLSAFIALSCGSTATKTSLHPSQVSAPLCADAAPFRNCKAYTFTPDRVWDFDWTISTWWSENRTHSPRNIWVEDELLMLKVSGGTPRGQTSIGAEISTGTRLFQYGSFRTVAQVTNEPGTVFGWFYYFDDNTEIDIEILSNKDTERLIHFTVHENIGPETHRIVELPFQPSEGFHEYRFDWFPSRVEFFVDSQNLATISVNVPQDPGRILMNHWTSSSDGWGGGPPKNDAIARIRSIEMHHP